MNLALLRCKLRSSACRRRPRGPAAEAGITLIETVLAMTIFIGVSTSLVGVLTSSIAAHSVSRERTIAEQAANDKVESIRRVPYAQVGTPSGNPTGTVPATDPVTRNGLIATMTTQISYVNDPTPTSYATSANYKKAVVTVTRDRDGKQLTRVVTHIAPPARAPYGGINNAIVNAQAVDYYLSTPVPDASVTMANGPDPTRTDVTDSTGTVSFAAVTPNPTTGPTAYYDLTVSKTGYVTFASDLPPAAAAHVQLSPSQTFNTAIRVFKPVSINLQMVNADATPYTGPATVKVTSGLTGVTRTIVVPGSSATLTDLNGDQIIPGVSYTVQGLKSSGSGMCANPVPRYVPDNYPTVLTTTFTLSFGLCPSGWIRARIKQDQGSGLDDVAGATVVVTGGPNDISLSGTTGNNGEVFFVVPAGSGYTVTATKGSASASATASVALLQQTTVDINLPPPPPTGRIAATVNWGAPLADCTNCVTLSGGPDAISVTGSTNSSGTATFLNVPVGSGYTITATKNTVSGSATASVTANATTNVTFSLPVGTVNATVRWGPGPTPSNGAAITVTGGPLGGTVATGATDSSGAYSNANLPAGPGTYTIQATKGSATTSTTFTIPSSGSVANVTLSLPVRTTVVLTVQNNLGVGVGAGAQVTMTGGPEPLNYADTTDVNSQVTFSNVPAATNIYTAKAWNCASTADKSRTATITVTAGATTQSMTLAYNSGSCPP